MSNLISVLLPSKNAGNYIKKSVESILNQTYQNFELIIIDESVDDTENIISSFKSDKIIYRKVYDSNISKSLNLTLKLARGDIVARMDADDISHPERFEVQLNYLKNHKDIHLVGSNFNFIDVKGNILSEKKLPECHEKIEYWMPILSTLLHATMMTYKEILESVNGYTAVLDRAEDIDLFFRLFRKGYKFYNIQEYLYYYRINKYNSEKIISTQKIFINLSYKYIALKHYNNYDRQSRYDKNFKIGLLEYYHGKMSESRKYLFKALISKPVNLIFILRYFVFTLLGTKIMKTLRDKGIISYISKLFNKYLNYNSTGI